MSVLQITIIALIYASLYTTVLMTLTELPFAFSFASGMICGAVLGDWKTGLMIGATIQTLNMAPVTAGSTINYDLCTATFIAVPLAITTGMSAQLALSIAIPFAILGVFLDPLAKTINSLGTSLGNKAAETGDPKYLMLGSVAVPLINFPIRFLIIFLTLFLGVPVMNNVIAVIPQWLLNGLTVMGGVLPAVGFALFLSVIGKKSLIVYFFFGYYVAYVTGQSTIVLAIFGVILAILHQKFTGGDDSADMEEAY